VPRSHSWSFLFPFDSGRCAVQKPNERADFYEYRDAEMSMRLPLYLRQKKGGMRYFEAPPKKRKDNPVHGLSIEFLNHDVVKVRYDIMCFTDPRANEERMGVRGQ